MIIWIADHWHQCGSILEVIQFRQGSILGSEIKNIYRITLCILLERWKRIGRPGRRSVQPFASYEGPIKNTQRQVILSQDHGLIRCLF